MQSGRRPIAQSTDDVMFSVKLMEDLLRPLSAYAFRLDADYRVSYLSDHVHEVTSFTSEDLLGVQVIDPQWGERGVEVGLDEYHSALLNQEPVMGQSYERLLVSGERGVIMDSMLPRFGPDGRFEGYDGISMILSEMFKRADANGSLVSVLKNRAEELERVVNARTQELEQSNKLLTEVLDAMGEGLLVTSGTDLSDPENKILFHNPTYLSLLGFSADEVYPGLPVYRLAQMCEARGDAPEHGFDDVDDNLNKGEVYTLQLPSLGRTLLTRATVRPGGGFVIVHTDVTELQEHTHMLEAARKQADIANQAKSNFLASMSHEIRTPMNGIVGMTDLLAETRLKDEQVEYVDTIRASALALTALISDILDFSKVESGRFELTPSSFMIADMCREVMGLMRPMAENKGLAADVRIDDEVPEVVRADGARLRQILVNLIGNAIKFTLTGHVRLHVTGTNPVSFRVEDTGIGIPSDKLERIFAPFEQAQGGLQRRFEGTGLGLAISQKLAKAMGGGICVQSVEGEGTVFDVSLPMEVAARSDLPASGAAARSGSGSIEGAHVLVAEDNRTNQVVVRSMLKKLGVTCEIVDDGRAAVEAFDGSVYDAVLMDLSMPRMDGLDATRLIRAGERADGRVPTPIIALTGNAFAQDQLAAKEAGMVGFLSKPIQLKALQEELARHLSEEPAGATAKAG